MTAAPDRVSAALAGRYVAEAFAMAGDTERAFELLEQAVNEGLRESPRYGAIAATAVRRTAEFDAAVAAG